VGVVSARSEASRDLPVLLDRRRFLPWKISFKGGACAIAAGDAPLGAPLKVIFARRHNARRGENGLATGAGAVIGGT